MSRCFQSDAGVEPQFAAPLAAEEDGGGGGRSIEAALALVVVSPARWRARHHVCSWYLVCGSGSRCCQESVREGRKVALVCREKLFAVNKGVRDWVGG